MLLIRILAVAYLGVLPFALAAYLVALDPADPLGWTLGISWALASLAYREEARR